MDLLRQELHICQLALLFHGVRKKEDRRKRKCEIERDEVKKSERERELKRESEREKEN